MSRHARSAEGPRRSFSLAITLSSGHGFDARVVRLQDVKDILRRYMFARADCGEPFLSGHLWETVLLRGSADGDSGEVPAAIFAGQANGLNHCAVPCHLDELAGMLIDALGQQQVQIAYGEKQWIVE